MASIEMKPAASGTTKRKSHYSPSIDMTPMVDLGFLLITFFIFTTTLMDKHSTALVMPKEGPGMDLPASKALTVVLGSNNQVIAYTGRWEDALRDHTVVETNYTEQEGIGRLIRDRQQKLQQQEGRKGRDGLTLVIKPTPQASYKNIVAALDETTINAVARYALVDPTPEEKTYSESRASKP